MNGQGNRPERLTPPPVAPSCEFVRGSGRPRVALTHVPTSPSGPDATEQRWLLFRRQKTVAPGRGTRPRVPGGRRLPRQALALASALCGRWGHTCHSKQRAGDQRAGLPHRRPEGAGASESTGGLARPACVRGTLLFLLPWRPRFLFVRKPARPGSAAGAWAPGLSLREWTPALRSSLRLAAGTMRARPRQLGTGAGRQRRGPRRLVGRLPVLRAGESWGPEGAVAQAAAWPDLGSDRAPRIWPGGGSGVVLQWVVSVTGVWWRTRRRGGQAQARGSAPGLGTTQQ